MGLKRFSVSVPVRPVGVSVSSTDRMGLKPEDDDSTTTDDNSFSILNGSNGFEAFADLMADRGQVMFQYPQRIEWV